MSFLVPFFESIGLGVLVLVAFGLGAVSTVLGTLGRFCTIERAVQGLMIFAIGGFALLKQGLGLQVAVVLWTASVAGFTAFAAWEWVRITQIFDKLDNVEAGVQKPVVLWQPVRSPFWRLWYQLTTPA